MQLDVSNLKVVTHHDGGYTLNIMMPDGSGNYLHTGNHDMESILIIRQLLLEKEFYDQDLKIIPDKKYYRLELTVSDVNNDKYVFHSRMLNLNDVIFERDQLLK